MRVEQAAWETARVMTKRTALLWMGFLTAWVAACGSQPTTPSTGTYQGEWTGTTAQGTPIAFTVSADEKVTSITIGYNFNGCSGSHTFANLNLETTPNVICIPGPCSVLLPSFRSFTYLAGTIDGPRTTINGMFPAANRAEGQVAFANYPQCGSALGVGWSAARR